MNSVLKRLQTLDIRLYAVAISCLVSLINIGANPILNDDAFDYLKGAEVFSEQGLNVMLTTYGWFGYSVLIALVDAVLPLGAINSAHLIDMTLFALLVYAFITLVKEYHPSPRAGIIAAIVILCFPTINEMRFNLIRDFGFWAFSLCALVQLIRYNKSRRLGHAAGWLLCMAAAIFFRLEGLLLLIAGLLAPLAPGNGDLRERSVAFFRLFAIFLAGMLLVLLVSLTIGVNLFKVFNFAYRWYLPLLLNYSETLATALQNLDQSAFVSHFPVLSNIGPLILVITYLYSVTATLVESLTPAASLLLLYGFIKYGCPLKKKDNWTLSLYLLGSVLALFIFVSIMHFLTTRYAAMAAILLLSVMPLYIETLYDRARLAGKLKAFRIAAGVCVVYFVVDVLISFGYSKDYVIDAIDWSRENITAGSGFRTNSYPMAYYTALVDEYDKVDTDPKAALAALQPGDYLALEQLVNDDDITPELERIPKLRELTRFANKRGDAIVVYRYETAP